MELRSTVQAYAERIVAVFKVSAAGKRLDDDWCIRCAGAGRQLHKTASYMPYELLAVLMGIQRIL